MNGTITPISHCTHSLSHTHILTHFGSSWTKLVHANCVRVPRREIQHCTPGLPQQSSPMLTLRFYIGSISRLNQDKPTSEKQLTVPWFGMGVTPPQFAFFTLSIQLKGNSWSRWRFSLRKNSTRIVKSSKTWCNMKENENGLKGVDLREYVSYIYSHM